MVALQSLIFINEMQTVLTVKHYLKESHELTVFDWSDPDPAKLQHVKVISWENVAVFCTHHFFLKEDAGMGMNFLTFHLAE